MDNDIIIELLDECISHLEYCNYGDRWERECAEDLIKRVAVYQEEKDGD